MNKTSQSMYRHGASCELLFYSLSVCLSGQVSLQQQPMDQSQQQQWQQLEDQVGGHIQSGFQLPVDRNKLHG